MTGNQPDKIDARALRLLIGSHVALWVYGAVLAGLHIAGLLGGMLRDSLALIAFAGLAACLFLIFKIAPSGDEASRKPGTARVGGRTFLVMVGFFVSVCGFVLLLSVLGLNGVTFEF